MKRLVCPVALLVAASAASAQLAVVGPTHSIRGVVFDSIARAPLSGAVVQAAMFDSSGKDKRTIGAPSRTFTAVSDSAGRFLLAGLPSGKYGLGFQHDALAALGIDSPVRGIDLGAD